MTATPCAGTTPNPTDWLVTPDLDKPEGWKYPIRHDIIGVLTRMTDMHYHRENDANNLLRIIKGRTVGVMLHGGSIAEFERKAGEFADLDMCYVSVNRFAVMEKRILNKMGKRLDVVFLMSEQEIPQRIKELHEFLDRGRNMLMTTFSALSWLEQEDREHIVECHDQQIYLMPRLLCRPSYPPSLMLLLAELDSVGVGKVVLFGADGYLGPAQRKDPESTIGLWEQEPMRKTYFAHREMKPGRPFGLIKDTLLFNNTYRAGNVRVWNCSPKSFLKHIPVITYDSLRGIVA